MMERYFRMMFRQRDEFEVARRVGAGDTFNLPDGPVRDWEIIDLELSDGDFPDYLASDLGCRMCSQNLRDLLIDHAAPRDSFQWLEVRVTKEWDSRAYFILHFPNPPDVLDELKTIFADDFVVKPVVSAAKAHGHQVFAYPKCGTLALFVAPVVKEAIEAAGYTGMVFSPLPVT